MLEGVLEKVDKLLKSYFALNHVENFIFCSRHNERFLECFEIGRVCDLISTLKGSHRFCLESGWHGGWPLSKDRLIRKLLQ